MNARTVADRAGKTWRVERRLFLFPRLRRLDLSSDGLDGVDFVPDVTGGGDGFGGLLTGLGLAIVATILLALAFTLVVPLILFALEVVLGIFLVGARAVGGRWKVVARCGTSRLVWDVRGREAARELLGTVADALESGARLPPPWEPL